MSALNDSDEKHPPSLPSSYNAHARISLLGSLRFGDCYHSRVGPILTNTSADLRNLELTFSQFCADNIPSKEAGCSNMNKRVISHPPVVLSS